LYLKAQNGAAKEATTTTHCLLLAVLAGAFLTPDITAPGVDIYAPVSKNKTGRSYEFLSGTSM
jgi:hypothetical protein